MHLLKPKEVAKLLGTSESWVYKASERGFLPSVRMPSVESNGKRQKETVRFKEEDLWDFIEKHYRKSDT